MAVTSVSDAAVEILRVCQDGLRFRVHGGLQHPQYDWLPGLDHGPYPIQLIVCQGVPNRVNPSDTSGDQSEIPWYQGLLPRRELVEAAVAEVRDEAGESADEAMDNERHRIADEMHAVAAGGLAWQKYGVEWAEGTPPLGRPKIENVLLSRTIYVLPERLRDVQFPPVTEPDSVAFLAENYPKRPEDGVPLWGQRVAVTQYGEYTLQWNRARDAEIGAWVAISFEGFRPGRRSADLIAMVTPGHLFRSDTE